MRAEKPQSYSRQNAPASKNDTSHLESHRSRPHSNRSGHSDIRISAIGNITGRKNLLNAGQDDASGAVLSGLRQLLKRIDLRTANIRRLEDKIAQLEGNKKKTQRQ